MNPRPLLGRADVRSTKTTNPDKPRVRSADFGVKGKLMLDRWRVAYIVVAIVLSVVGISQGLGKMCVGHPGQFKRVVAVHQPSLIVPLNCP
jgi:hypothetical protein